MKYRLIGYFSIILSLFVWRSSSVFAASQDLQVTCFGSDEIDDCVISPAGGKLFDEQNVLPGDTFTQFIDLTNLTGQPLNALWDLNSGPNSSTPSLAEVITIEVRKETLVGEVIMSATPLSQLLLSPSFVPLSPLLANQTQRYVVTAHMNPSAGNQYQAVSQDFDVLVHMQLSDLPIPPLTNTTNFLVSAQTAGSSSLVNAPECADTPPSSAPTLNIGGSVSANGQVVLNWTSVSPVTNYAINFGVEPGNYLFGNAGVGNVTTYTVAGLTPGGQYYFQVLGINGCAPGPRSNEVVTPGQPVVLGAVTAPAGFTPGEVLGESIITMPLPLPTTPSVMSFILGAEDATLIQSCSPQNWWLALFLLIIQIVGTLGGILVFHHSMWKRRIIIAGTATLGSIYLFYMLSACDCDGQTLLAWLCRLYWLISLGTVGVIQVLIPKLGYAGKS